MIIYLAFFQSLKRHNIPAYSFWEYYIKNGIKEAGDEWSEELSVDWAEGLVYSSDKIKLSQWKTEMWEKTVNDIRKKHVRNPISIFLCYLYPHQVDIQAIREIQKMGISCVNFYCDNVRDYSTVPPEFKVFDLMWVPEFEALRLYETAKVSHIYLPMPMWVDPRYRDISASETHGISFIGSKDILREELLSKLVTKGLPIEIRGSGWLNSREVEKREIANSHILKNTFRFVQQHGITGLSIKILQKLAYKQQSIPSEFIFPKPDDEEYTKITSESKITLGINRVPTYKRLNSSPLVYSRLRDIEAPMLGACYLTEYSEGLENLYDLGKEVEAYRSIEELSAKCRELLQSPEKRTLLRTQAQKRALSDHCIPNSLNKIKTRLFK